LFLTHELFSQQLRQSVSGFLKFICAHNTSLEKGVLDPEELQLQGELLPIALQIASWYFSGVPMSQLILSPV
jgi:hypothetical protein